MWNQPHLCTLSFNNVKCTNFLCILLRSKRKYRRNINCKKNKVCMWDEYYYFHLPKIRVSRVCNKKLTCLCLIRLYCSAFYRFFLPFFVLEILKFNYDYLSSKFVSILLPFSNLNDLNSCAPHNTSLESLFKSLDWLPVLSLSSTSRVLSSV